MPRKRRIVGRPGAALAAALAMTLPGCGQKGPLTLPPPAASTPAAPAAPSAALPRPDAAR